MNYQRIRRPAVTPADAAPTLLSRPAPAASNQVSPLIAPERRPTYDFAALPLYAPAPPIQRKRQGAPLPHKIKAGIEKLSGRPMDDLRVHYGSPTPARLDADAHTQGSEIHLGPGQERLLPHEAWHVVQQKQGRVKPTSRMGGHSLNEDPGLEHEADRMGVRATAAPASRAEKSLTPASARLGSGPAAGGNPGQAGPVTQLCPFGHAGHENMDKCPDVSLPKKSQERIASKGFGLGEKHKETPTRKVKVKKSQKFKSDISKTRPGTETRLDRHLNAFASGKVSKARFKRQDQGNLVFKIKRATEAKQKARGSREVWAHMGSGAENAPLDYFENGPGLHSDTDISDIEEPEETAEAQETKAANEAEGQPEKEREDEENGK